MTNTNNNQDLQAIIFALQAENAALKSGAKKKATGIKVSEKGGVSVYGINSRFPVTLYANQWQKLIELVPELTSFIEANKAVLAVKPVETK